MTAPLSSIDTSRLTDITRRSNARVLAALGSDTRHEVEGAIPEVWACRTQTEMNPVVTRTALGCYRVRSVIVIARSELADTDMDTPAHHRHLAMLLRDSLWNIAGLLLDRTRDWPNRICRVPATDHARKVGKEAMRDHIGTDPFRHAGRDPFELLVELEVPIEHLAKQALIPRVHPDFAAHRLILTDAYRMAALEVARQRILKTRVKVVRRPNLATALYR